MQLPWWICVATVVNLQCCDSYEEYLWTAPNTSYNANICSGNTSEHNAIAFLSVHNYYHAESTKSVYMVHRAWLVDGCRQRIGWRAWKRVPKSQDLRCELSRPNEANLQKDANLLVDLKLCTISLYFWGEYRFAAHDSLQSTDAHQVQCDHSCAHHCSLQL